MKFRSWICSQTHREKCKLFSRNGYQQQAARSNDHTPKSDHSQHIISIILHHFRDSDIKWTRSVYAFGRKIDIFTEICVFRDQSDLKRTAAPIGLKLRPAENTNSEYHKFLATSILFLQTMSMGGKVKNCVDGLNLWIQQCSVYSKWLWQSYNYDKICRKHILRG